MAARRCIFTLVVALLVGAACGRSHSTQPLPAGVNSVSNGIVFTRQDGSPIPMGRTYAVCCSTWERGFIDRETLKIFFYDPAKKLSYWKVFLIPGEILGDSVFTLPTPNPGDGPLALFANDVASGNEANGDRAGSSGTVTVHSFTCGKPARIDATFDAVLGSEFAGGAPIRVQGRFTATVYANPISCVFGF